MHGINRSAVLDIVRREGPIARTDIASFLQVSLMTVVRIVDELIEEDLVRPTGKKEFSGGRRRPLLEFNAEGHVVIGVDMNETRLYGAVADLAGNVLMDLTLPQFPEGGIHYEPLENIIEQLLVFAQGTGKHIRGIGVGAPGITYYEDNKVQWAPTLEWRNFPVKEKLTERFNLPVILDNDVNLSALGEMWFGVGQNCTNLVLMIVGKGIGAGIIIDGAVYRGSHLTAGEIGFLLPDRSHLGIKREGHGALESLASDASIVSRAKEILKESLSPDQLKKITIEDVFSAFQVGEDWSQPIIIDTVDYLAQTVATLAVCFDPEIIVLSGGVARFADLLIDLIGKRIDGVIPIRPKLVTSHLGSKAAVLGTIIEILYNTTDVYMVRKLS
jgi:predicted NBD/HSP70 family sugar kinase